MTPRVLLRVVWYRGALTSCPFSQQHNRYASFEELMSSCSDWMACTVPFVACTVPLVASVSYGRPCLLTPGMSCQYDPVWEKGALHGVVGAGVRRGPATYGGGPRPRLASARRLGLVGGGSYSCERVVVAEAETCCASGLS
jgi:hypothetical protein